MRKMVTSDLIVQAMNATAAESVIVEEIPEAGEVVTRQPAEMVTAEQAEAEEEKTQKAT
jgi:serine acetyltransferase